MAVVTDETQQTVASYEYDAYGNLTSSSGNYASGNPWRFSTKYYDEGSGLYYYGFRLYSPGLGRWINRDPISEAGGLNLYGFVGNGPINYIDTVGMMIELADTAALTRPFFPEVTFPRITIPRTTPPMEPTGFPIGPVIRPSNTIDDNTDMTDPSTWPAPPTSSPVTPGEPSRKKPRERGEKSLYDDKGGEWRPHKPDKFHPDGHWNYRPPDGAWQDVPTAFYCPLPDNRTPLQKFKDWLKSLSPRSQSRSLPLPVTSA